MWNSFLRSIDHKRWQNGGRVVKARARPPSHKFDAEPEVRTFPWVRTERLLFKLPMSSSTCTQRMTCTCFLLENNLHGQDSTFLCLTCPRLHAHCTCAHFHLLKTNFRSERQFFSPLVLFSTSQCTSLPSGITASSSFLTPTRHRYKHHHRGI